MKYAILNPCEQIDLEKLTFEYIYEKYKDYIEIVEKNNVIDLLDILNNENILINEFFYDKYYIYQSIYIQKFDKDILSNQLVSDVVYDKMIIIKKNINDNKEECISKNDVVNCILNKFLINGILVKNNNEIENYKYINFPSLSMIYSYIIDDDELMFYCINNDNNINNIISQFLNEKIYGNIVITLKNINNNYNSYIDKEIFNNFIKGNRKKYIKNNIFPIVFENYTF